MIDQLSKLEVERSIILENIGLIEQQIRRTSYIGGMLFFTVIVPIIAKSRIRDLKEELELLRNDLKEVRPSTQNIYKEDDNNIVCKDDIKKALELIDRL